MQEEAWPHMSGQTFLRAVLSVNTNTGVGVDGFHPRISVDLSGQVCREIAKVHPPSSTAGKLPSRAEHHDFLS